MASSIGNFLESDRVAKCSTSMSKSLVLKPHEGGHLSDDVGPGRGRVELYRAPFDSTTEERKGAIRWP